jgi:hypothetical protein
VREDLEGQEFERARDLCRRSAAVCGSPGWVRHFCRLRRYTAKWRGLFVRTERAIISIVRKKVLLQVLRGTADANIRFDDLRSLLTALGFVERVKGSHHIFTKPDVAEILNLQPRGALAKP